MELSGDVLLIIEYLSDAERKRIDYLLEKWDKKLKVKKLHGTAALVSGDCIYDMIEELYSRLPKERIKIKKLSEIDFEVEKKIREYTVELRASKENIKSFLGFLMAKQKAVLKHETQLEKVYIIKTKKGIVDVHLQTISTDTGINIRFKIEGYGDAPDFILERIKKEIGFFKEAKQNEKRGHRF